MIRFLFIGMLVGSALALGIGWAQTSLPALEVLPGVLAALWLVAVLRGFSWASSVGFSLMVLLSAVGLSKGMLLPCALVGVVASLVAWDLFAFGQRLRYAASDDYPVRLELQHLAQLGVVVALGLVLAWISSTVRLAFKFEWQVVMALIALGGLSTLIGWLRRNGE